MIPHSREWYRQLATVQGVYRYPWQQVLLAPGGEDGYTQLLQDLLGPQKRVLEAGCAHGPDARLFADQVAHWSGYDWMEDFLIEARQGVPGGTFVCWDGKSEVPAALQGPHDLLVSRRGPTSFLRHLKKLAVPAADVLCIYPTAAVQERVQGLLSAAEAKMLGEWVYRTAALLPTFADFAAFSRWNRPAATEQELQCQWSQQAGPDGFPFVEERYMFWARMPH